MRRDEAGKGLANGHSHKNAFFTTLFVDGMVPVDKGLEDFLKTEGHFILKAGSAEEAIAMTYRFQPDLILLDSHWQGASGLDLLPDLLAQWASAAIVVLAVDHSVTEAVEAMKLGAVDVLEQPFDLRRLKTVMDAQKALFMSRGSGARWAQAMN